MLLRSIIKPGPAAAHWTVKDVGSGGELVNACAGLAQCWMGLHAVSSFQHKADMRQTVNLALLALALALVLALASADCENTKAS